MCNNLIRLIQPQKQDSEDSSAKTEYHKTNIPIFFKPYITKACYLFVLLSLMAGSPLQVNAGFFSDLKTIVLGTSVNANEIPQPENVNDYNSQTVPLLESSVNPDFKNINSEEDAIIVQDDSFIYSDSFLGTDNSVKFEKSSLSDKIYVYTVEQGDTLSEIAESFDVSQNTIRWENNLSGQTISVGQKLNILPVTGVKHIVKKGDTISKIADKYEADSEDILIFNGLSKGDGLKQGDILFVPNGIIKPAVVANKKPSSGSSGASSASNTKAPSGYYIRPAVGITTSPYGPRRGGFHYGVDIGNKRGTTVAAAASGVVTKVVGGCAEGKSSCGGRYGNYVVIQHPNGTSTMYAHLNAVSVSVGFSVSQGQKIGTLGNTGRSTGPHLHFEVRNANGSTMRPPV